MHLADTFIRIRCGGEVRTRISTRGVIIWQGVENGHNTGPRGVKNAGL